MKEPPFQEIQGRNLGPEVAGSNLIWARFAWDLLFQLTMWFLENAQEAGMEIDVF